MMTSSLKLRSRPDHAQRLRAMESRTGSVGDCSKIANYRASKQNLFRRRSTRRRISNAQRLADLEDFINRSLSKTRGFSVSLLYTSAYLALFFQHPRVAEAQQHRIVKDLRDLTVYQR
ncbi:hypothetical protein ANCCEY_01718 [Ancylostoma ceylanicum]|uniref:Uncharacterized protein n=1 Tax=Ancylostoma ceylanicum TaxID=53326 RepID=A0A0D6M9R2_9BILA|nr:hypothetical protein ANCCEY_01718 [Ancylostoma ceylanicum]